MPKKAHFRDCTNTCKSEKHASDLISAIALPSSMVLDRYVASYISNTCCSFDSVRDGFGRSVLHITASVGRNELCQWLIRYSNVDINAQDYESGYTPLHRSIFYGHVNVAVTLMQLGANLLIKDKEDYYPLDLCVRNINVEWTPFILHSKFATEDVPSVVSSGKTEKKSSISKNIDVSYNALSKVADDKQDCLNNFNNVYFTEAYTWGTNHNYTNGFGAERSKKAPEFLEFFDKKNEAIIDICMNKCHTLFVSLTGNVWSCGLGQGGRLGLSSEETVLIPRKIVFPSSVPPNSPSSSSNSLFCMKASAGQDHSIFICNDNQIFTCGLNTYHQLGLNPPPSSVNKPQKVNLELWNENALGVAASTYHSVIWTNSTLYTCGLHGGQLGHPNSASKTISTFTKVPCVQLSYATITNVAVSDGTTVVVTDAHHIFVLNEYKHPKIDFKHVVKHVSKTETSLACKLSAGDGQLSGNLTCLQTVLKVSVVGGHLDAKKVKTFNSSYRPEDLKIAVLLWNGTVYLWKKLENETETRLISCDFLVKHEIKVADLVLNSSSMMLVTRTGEAFVGCGETLEKTFNKSQNSGYTTVSYHHTEIEDESYVMSLRKIENAHRAVSIFSDPKGDNFAMLQQRSADVMDCSPDIKSSFHSDMEKFYLECFELDMFPDITYKVDTKSFSAHKYIIASCSEELASLKSTNGVVRIENVHPDIFQQVLTFAYSGSCDLFKVGPCSIKILRGNEKSPGGSPVKYEDPLKLACKVARDYKISKLVSRLDKFRYEKQSIYQRSKNDFIRPVPFNFSRNKFKNLCDIKIESQDGQVFHAHKCILVARMEYFKLMLSGFWMESSNDNDAFHLSVPGVILQEILDYLYTDNVSKSISKKDMNFWCSLLVAADQFVLTTLKEICENALVRCLDIRNTIDLFLFADTMRAKQLKKSCIEFISINLPSFLNNGSLEKLSDEQLNALSEFYRHFSKETISSRRLPQTLPVYSNACDPEEIISLGNSCPVDWEISRESDHSADHKKKPVKSFQIKKIKRVRKTSTTETDKGKKSDEENKMPDVPHENIIIDMKPQLIHCLPESNWIEVEKQLKSVKSRLKINSAVKERPELIEQKTNFVPLKSLKNTPEHALKVTESPSKDIDSKTKTSPITISIDLLNITPKMSQKQRKKLRTVSESSPTKCEEPESSPKNAWNMKCCSPPSEDVENTSIRWGPSRSPEPVSFSAIVASEKKQKTIIKKETKKIEAKSLQLTQIEDQAIEDLKSFYNANDVYDENIIVQRVTYNFEAPQWITR